MADLESRVGRLEMKVNEHDVKFEQIMTKLDMFISESRETRNRQDNDMREFRERHDSDMREIRQSIDGMGKHVRNMSAATILGIAAIVVAVLLK